MKENSWEYSGRSVEEATQIALEELGLEIDDIHVEVLEEPQKGFLGIGGKEARIKVELIGEWEVLESKARAKDSDIGGIEEPPIEEPSLGTQFEEFAVDKASKPVRTVQEILDILQIDAMVEAKERDDAIIVDIWGEDIAILIGRGGSTLDALQYLVNIGCRKSGEVDKKIVVDAEGYRKRRKAKIERQAEQLAGKVVSQSKSIEMPAMNSSERKIVHMFLRGYEGVWTESSGEGNDRRVVIHPGKERST
jgi:spoIIIJ-associated protein